MLNLATILGFLTCDAEYRTGTDGRPYTVLSVVTHERWTPRDGRPRERADAHRVVILNEGLAARGATGLRGDLVFVEGHLQTRLRKDRDGVERQVTEVVVGPARTVLHMLGQRLGDPNEAEAAGLSLSCVPAT